MKTVNGQWNSSAVVSKQAVSKFEEQLENWTAEKSPAKYKERQ